MTVTKEDFRIKEYRGKFIIERKDWETLSMLDGYEWRQVGPSGYFIRKDITYLICVCDNLDDARLNALTMIDTINNEPRYHTI
jgi:hypothetical protein